MNQLRLKYIIAALLLQTSVVLAQTPTYPPTAQVAVDFKALLQRPIVEAKPSFTVTHTDSMDIEKGSIYTEATEKMPVVIYKPVIKGQTKFPVVIFLHGTGGSKDAGEVKAVLLPLVKRGIMAVSIDARYHGERVEGGAHGSREYVTAAYQAWKTNDATHHAYPFLYDTSYDLLQLVDYLVTRPDVNADRIGMGGISMGGMETYMAAAVDPRIKVVVVGIAAQSFKWVLDNNQWQGRAGTISDAHKKAAADLGDTGLNTANVTAVWNKILPGVTGEFDCPSLLRLIAPRPLLILSKDKDANNPYGGAQIAFAAATDAYKQQKAGNNINIVVQPNLGHVFNAEDTWLSVEWFARWLLK
ncbi:alpha/beta hydrolase family protein [Mucilaginibacter calamicampi]|uniref:Alpha/beta hydrolase family protein n=1 Tax=Mucilaginibacter calamicampi TaxID=1302352 RepID=A0ABW2YWI5_9SPHI